MSAVPDRVARWAAAAAAAALVLATATYALIVLDVIASPPTSPAATGLEPYVREYLAHRRALLPYDRTANILMITGLVGVAVGAVRWRHWQIRTSTAGPDLAATAIVAGAVVTAVAQVIYLGAIDRVLAVAGIDGFDPATLATFLDVADRVDDAVESLGEVLVAAGLIILARDPKGRAKGRLARYSANLLATALIGAAGAAAVRSSWIDPALFMVGLFFGPLWLVSTAWSMQATSGRPGG